MPGGEAVAWLAKGCTGDQSKSNRLSEPAKGEDIQVKNPTAIAKSCATGFRSARELKGLRRFLVLFRWRDRRSLRRAIDRDREVFCLGA
jgi:hypothetical protein